MHALPHEPRPSEHERGPPADDPFLCAHASAFREILRRRYPEHYEDIFSMACEDWIRHSRGSSFKPSQAHLGYLLEIAENCSKELYRKRSRYRDVLHKLSERRPQPRHDPTLSADFQEFLDRLNPELSAVWRGREIDGLTRPQLAAQLDISEDRVDRLHFIANLQLLKLSLMTAPPNIRQCAVLFAEGHTEAQIAEMLHQSQDYVRACLHEARALLRATWPERDM